MGNHKKKISQTYHHSLSFVRYKGSNTDTIQRIVNIFAVFFHADMLNLNYLSVALCYEEMTKVESLNPLRTLHSAVPLKEMDRFFDTLIGKKLVFPTLASRSRTISKESNFSELSKGANENLDSS